MKYIALYILTAIPLILLTLNGCTRCPESEYGDLAASVPSPETKNDGVDLQGWTYETIVSKQSGETHYFYRYPAVDPNKPTFVFLHGIIFDGKNFLAFKPLFEHFNLIAYDVPGQSRFYRGNTDDFSALLTDFFTAMGLRRIYLGGVSLGGQIAMIYAAKKRPVPLDGLLLISTEIAKTQRELRKSRARARATEKITDRDERKTLCVVTKLVNRKKKDAKDMAILDQFVPRRVAFYNQVLDTNLKMETPVPLRNIKVPTLIIHGDADTVVDIEDGEALGAYIPNSTFVTIKGGEHTIAYTHADRIVSEIEKRFISGRKASGQN